MARLQTAEAASMAAWLQAEAEARASARVSALQAGRQRVRTWQAWQASDAWQNVAETFCEAEAGCYCAEAEALARAAWQHVAEAADAAAADVLAADALAREALAC